jgi:lipoprotein-releasing system permease protein
MFFSPFLASRYLKPRRSFVSIITLISIIGVALGVWLLAVVIAVFTGYGERIKDSILGFEPHLVVDSGGIMTNWPETVEKIKAVEGIVSVSPYVRGQVVMDFGGLRSAPLIRGILQPEGAELEHMQKKIALRPDPQDPAKMIRRGEFLINDPYSAVIGDGIAESQNIDIGDKLVLYSPKDVEAVMSTLDAVEKATTEEERKTALNAARQVTAPQEVTVTGIFDSGHYDFDSNIVFVNLETAQILYNFELEDCHGVAVRTDDGFLADKYQEKLYTLLPQQYRILTWFEMHRVIFDAVAAERQAMYLILFMIMIVSGFCIMNTMVTVVSQKRSEIGLVKALGATEGQIAWVFLFQGIFVGMVGVVLGMVIAQITLHFRNDLAGFVGSHFGVELFSEEVYKVDGGLPAKQTWSDAIIISVGAFLASTVASVIPALIAAFLQPARALRSE